MVLAMERGVTRDGWGLRIDREGDAGLEMGYLRCESNLEDNLWEVRGLVVKGLDLKTGGFWICSTQILAFWRIGTEHYLRDRWAERRVAVGHLGGGGVSPRFLGVNSGRRKREGKFRQRTACGVVCGFPEGRRTMCDEGFDVPCSQTDYFAKKRLAEQG